MASGENLTSPPESEQRQAYEYCEAVRSAVELTELSNNLENAAKNAVHSVTSKSVLGQLPFRLKVTIPEGGEAFITNDDNVIDENAKSFTATSIYSIDKHGVLFFDHTTHNFLRITGHDFDLYPVFDEPVVTD